MGTLAFISSSDADVGDEAKLPKAAAGDHVGHIHREGSGPEVLPLQKCF